MNDHDMPSVVETMEICPVCEDRVEDIDDSMPEIIEGQLVCGVCVFAHGREAIQEYLLDGKHPDYRGFEDVEHLSAVSKRLGEALRIDLIKEKDMKKHPTDQAGNASILSLVNIVLWFIFGTVIRYQFKLWEYFPNWVPRWPWEEGGMSWWTLLAFNLIAFAVGLVIGVLKERRFRASWAREVEPGGIVFLDEEEGR